MLALVLALIGAAPATDTVRLATYRYPRYDRAQALEPLRQLLGTQLARPVEITLYDDPAALRDAVKAGRVDVAVTNLASYLAIRDVARLNAIAVLDVPMSTLNRYRGVLLARKDSGIGTVDELNGQEQRLRYAEVVPGSTSGALVQAFALRNAGVDLAQFGERSHAGTHEGALTAVAENRADLAALAEEPWRTAAPEMKAALVQLWRSAPLPPGPVVCISRVAFGCEDVRAMLLTRAAGKAATELSRGWSETEGATRFRPVGADDYSAFLTP